jgi:hypothetical protein
MEMFWTTIHVPIGPSILLILGALVFVAFVAYAEGFKGNARKF